MSMSKVSRINYLIIYKAVESISSVSIWKYCINSWKLGGVLLWFNTGAMDVPRIRILERLLV